MLGTRVSKPDFSAAWNGLEHELARDLADAMRGATGTMKTELRDQVRRAGLGGRLANTWRANSYPASGGALNPAGWAYSNAPAIIDAFANGATIAPLAGKKYLWIPTKSVPRKPGAGRATSTKKMSPEQVEKTFNQDFIIRRGKEGHLLAFISQARGTTPRGRIRRVKKGRLASGPAAELVLMFTLVSSVTLKKLLDLQEAGDAGATDFVNRLNDNARSR